MIVTVRRLGGVGDAMAGMVGSVFRMIVWLVGRLKSIGWWGGGGGGGKVDGLCVLVYYSRTVPLETGNMDRA